MDAQRGVAGQSADEVGTGVGWLKATVQDRGLSAQYLCSVTGISGAAPKVLVMMETVAIALNRVWYLEASSIELRVKF